MLSRKDGDAVALNRTGTNGDLMTFRKNGAIKGSIEIDDSNIRITGLAGGPLFRNGFNIDSTEGLIEAFKDHLQLLLIWKIVSKFLKEVITNGYTIPTN